ncbi:hypothetical protein [Lacrimispora brassicae]
MFDQNMNHFRERNNYYTLEELNTIICQNNTVFDLYSVLISRNVIIGSDNIIYPGVIIDSDSISTIKIGNSNTFFNNTHLDAKNEGIIEIGDFNSFNDGPMVIKSNMKNSHIIFRNQGRFDGRISIFGQCKFGTGSQILGNINVYNCTLEDGVDFSNPNVEERAGLIKGMGNAKNLQVGKGMVINGFGEFSQEGVEKQLKYHPK